MSEQQEEVKRRIMALSDEDLLRMLDESPEGYEPFAWQAAGAELARRGGRAGVAARTVDEPPGDTASEVASDLFMGFDDVGTVSVGNPLLLFLEFVVGGWILMLFNIVLVIPILGLVWLFRRILVRTKPHSSLARKCDFCTSPAVGYKEICGKWGFLLVHRDAYLRGFLCESHTAQFVNRATRMNLMGVLCFIGGFAVTNTLFRTRIQLDRNIRILPPFAGQPEQTSPLEIARHFYDKAKARGRGGYIQKTRSYLAFAREFIRRALAEDPGGVDNAEILVLQAYVLLQSERLLDTGSFVQRESKQIHLDYLNEARSLIDKALNPAGKVAPSELQAAASNARDSIDARAKEISKRWV